MLLVLLQRGIIEGAYIMKNSKRIALFLSGLCLTASMCILPASARRNDDAWKAANYWAVQTYMNQQAQRGYYGNPYYQNTYGNYYNPYSQPYNYNYGPSSPYGYYGGYGY
jgi:hypothetical protein